MKKIFLLIIVLGAFVAVNAQSKKKVQFIKGIEKVSSLKKSDKKTNTISRNNPKHKKQNSKLLLNVKTEKSINSLWNIQFNSDVAIGSGIETNGSYFYVSQWNMDTIFVFNLNGTPFGKFTLPVVGIRDMAFDGTYFYGSNASNKIYKMDFTNHIIVDSIVCPVNVTVRHIAYDNVNNAFWVGDWDTDIYLINQSGQIINTISAVNHDLYGMYGSAFDNTTVGGPYLWVFDQGGNGCDIVMINISTGNKTGIIHNCIDDVASDLMDPIAGGMFISSSLVSGTVTLGGIIQRQRIIGYDLSSLIANNDIGVEDILSPFLSTGCSLSNSESITVRLRNYGLNSAGNFTLNMNLNNVNYNVNVPNTLNRFEIVDVTFSGTFDFSQPLVYKMIFNSSYSIDDNTTNDTAYYNLITGNGLISVDVLTDGYPSETYWEVYNNFSYDVYGSSDVMVDTNYLYSTDICVDTTQCYGFTIYDDYGDGILSPGYYEVFLNGNSVAYDDIFTTLFEEVPYIGQCDYADIGIVGITTPVSSCNLGSEEFVTVLVKNYGTQTVSNGEVAFSFNGTNYTEPLPFSINSQEVLEYTFVNICDLSVLGFHDLKVYSVLSTDMNALNDTINYEVENYTPATMPYVVDFDNEAVNSQLLIEDGNQDYFSWALSNTGGLNNSNCAVYVFNPSEPANDWLFSKCIMLNVGQQYYLNFYYKAQSNIYPEKLKVHLGQAPSLMAAFTDPLIDLNNITDTVFTYVSVPFTVDSFGTGNYFFGFNVYSDLIGWNLFVDDFSITETSSISENNSIQNQFTVYPNPAKNKITVEQVSNFSEKKNESTVFIFNIQGQLLYTKSFDTYKTDIDVRSMKEGLYILKIESNEHVWVKKFVKN